MIIIIYLRRIEALKSYVFLFALCHVVEEHAVEVGYRCSQYQPVCTETLVVDLRDKKIIQIRSLRSVKQTFSH